MWNFCKIFSKLKKTKPELVIKDAIKELPWHNSRVWANRSLNRVNKVIVHQTLSSGSVEAVNRYHITPSPTNHISPNGAPHICYHYVINTDGTVLLCNNLSSIVWHCKGQNTSSIGILVMGDFNAPGHVGKDVAPNKKQLGSLKQLMNYLLNHETLELDKIKIYGHSDFGKKVCPGYILNDFIRKYKYA